MPQLTRLAVSISERDGGAALRLTLALAPFIAGNALGVILTRIGRKKAWPLLLCVAALLCAALRTESPISSIGSGSIATLK